MRLARSLLLRRTLLLAPLLLLLCPHNTIFGQQSLARNNDRTSHIVLLGSTGPNGRRQFRCGGAYIGRNVIVAGGHCATAKNQPPLDTVRFGAGTANEQHFRIVNHTLHYRYKPQFEYHNMAIFFLDANPEASSRGIHKPACVLKPHMKSGKVQFVGDGSADGRGANLLTTELDVMPSEKCHEYYNPIPKLRFGVLLCCFCAMNSATAECSNMHSSPLQVVLTRSGKSVPFLIGHKSIGRACGVKSPAVFTRYGSYYEWMETITDLSLEANDCFARY